MNWVSKPFKDNERIKRKFDEILMANNNKNEINKGR